MFLLLVSALPSPSHVSTWLGLFVDAGFCSPLKEGILSIELTDTEVVVFFKCILVCWSEYE